MQVHNYEYNYKYTIMYNLLDSNMLIEKPDINPSLVLLLDEIKFILIFGYYEFLIRISYLFLDQYFLTKSFSIKIFIIGGIIITYII